MPQNKSRHNTQAGNVFIIILVGVFLFGALMFTFSRGGQKGSGNLTKQQAKIAAQEILNYARLVEGAVDRVRRNGCSESEISFENSVVTSYANPNSPTDKSCHIFESEGGRISYLSPNHDWLNKRFLGNSSFGDSVITGNNNIENFGSSNLDIIFYTPYIKDEVCDAINNLTNLTITNLENFGGGTGAYTGSFNAAISPNIGDEATELSGNRFFCIEKGASDRNFFFYGLLAR